MSTLRTSLRAYLTMRRGMGFKFQRPEERLTSFVRFMEEYDAAVITRKLALEWAMQTPNNRSWRFRLTDVRGFARHLRGVEPRTEVPETGILPRPPRPKPYLYTDAQIAGLLTAALRLPPSGALRRWTYHCLLGLLVVTGLRIGEALALHREDVDLKQGVITVREAKFGKSRLVPLHSTSRQILVRYTKRRDTHLCPPLSPYFFVAERGGRLFVQTVREVFWKLSRETGLRGPHDHSGPRLHDFRHHADSRIMPTPWVHTSYLGGFHVICAFSVSA